MTDLEISVVIPTFNMAEHLDGLWAALETSGLVGRVREVIIVDDGSTDGTPGKVEAYIARRHDPVTRFRSLRCAANRGRFRARLEGARLAESAYLLFLDTRLDLPPTFADRLFAYLPDDRCLQGVTRLRPERSLFDLYWDRTHLFLFRAYYRDVAQGLVITEENYDRYLTGTGAFACPRDAFLAACAPFEHADLLSDDTALLRRIVATHPIHVRPDFEFYWFPRRTLPEFLGRLWERGPGSAEYHVFESRGVYFGWLCAVGLVLALQVVAIGVGPGLVPISSGQIAAVVAAANLAGIAASTALFAHGAVEFVRLAPLHVAVVVTAGVSLLRGVIVVLFRRGRRAAPPVRS